MDESVIIRKKDSSVTDNNSSYTSFNNNNSVLNEMKCINVFKSLLVAFNIACLLASFICISIYRFEIKNFAFLSSIFVLMTYFLTVCFITSIKNDKKRNESSSTLQHQSSTSSPANDNKPDLIKSQIILTTIIIIIGFSDTLYNLTEFLNTLFLIINKQFDFVTCGYASIATVIIERFIKIFYQLFILLFIIQYENYYMALSKKVVYLKIFIFYLLLSFLIQWCYIILQQVYEDDMSCLTNSTLNTTITSFETYEPILFPLAIEFRIFCFIEIVNLYFCIEKINGVTEVTTLDQDVGESQSDDEIVIVERRQQQDSSQATPNDFYSIPIMFGIFLMSCTIGFIFFQNDNFDGKSNNSLILVTNEFFEVIILFVGIILLIFLLKNVLRMKNSRVSLKNSIMLVLWPFHKSRFQKNIGFCKQFSVWKRNDFATIEAKIDLFILNVSCLTLVVYSGLSISSLTEFINGSLSSTDTIKQTGKILGIVTLCILLIDVILQTLLIGFMLHNQNQARLKLKKLIQFLVLLNFILWLIDTFSAKKYFSNAYETSMWKIMGPMLIPVSLFYRIQSCVVLIKIFFDKYSLNTLPIQYKISLYTPMAIFSGFVERN